MTNPEKLIRLWQNYFERIRPFERDLARHLKRRDLILEGDTRLFRQIMVGQKLMNHLYPGQRKLLLDYAKRV